MRLLLAAIAGLAAPTTAIAADPAAAPQAVVSYLEMVAGATFNADEANRIVAVERRLAITDPVGRQRTWAAAAQGRRALAAASPARRALARHRARAAFQLAAQPDPTALSIVNAHDAAIVVDPARKEVVTVGDLRALAASNAFTGRLAGVAPPPAQLTPAAIADIRARYAREPATRLVLTEAAVRNAVRDMYWARLPAASRARLASALQRAVHTPDDVATAARQVDGAFANRYIADLRRRRQDAVARAVFPHGPLAGLVAMKRATVNLDALNMAWPHM